MASSSGRLTRLWPVGRPVISADALYENLNDGDTSNDPFIVSVRSAEHYALGHIPGAINIPWKQIAEPENLAKLPTDQPDRRLLLHRPHRPGSDHRPAASWATTPSTSSSA